MVDPGLITWLSIRDGVIGRGRQALYPPGLTRALGPARHRDAPVTQHHMDIAAALQSDALHGLPALRALVADRLTADGMPCASDDVLITQGGQQGLDLAAKLFIDRGDVIVTERPTFLGAIIAFNPCEPDYCSVPMDDDGMDTDALEQVLRTTQRVKLIYTVPDYQNPTGRTMSLARRQRLV